MGEAHQIEIPSEETGPNAPGQEEQVAPQEVTNEIVEETEPPNVEIPTDRPEWLPEKFENPEAMATAYKELESKLGDERGVAPTAESLQEYSTKFFENGELSEKDYAGLEGMGLSKDIVDTFIKGQQALVDNSVQQIFNEVGGETTYANMIEWARENISPEEVASYNSMVDSGDQNQSLMAVRGMFARYAQANNTGSTPSLVQGETSGSGTSAFQSVAQLTEAMSDPRYADDPAYRKSVQDRLSVSNIF